MVKYPDISDQLNRIEKKKRLELELIIVGIDSNNAISEINDLYHKAGITAENCNHPLFYHRSGDSAKVCCYCDTHAP